MKYLILCFPLFGCGPTCEEQGGHWVQEGFFYIWQPIDVSRGTGYVQAYPNYVCKKEKNT